MPSWSLSSSGQPSRSWNPSKSSASSGHWSWTSGIPSRSESSSRPDGATACGEVTADTSGPPAASGLAAGSFAARGSSWTSRRSMISRSLRSFARVALSGGAGSVTTAIAGAGTGAGTTRGAASAARARAPRYTVPSDRATRHSASGNARPGSKAVASSSSDRLML